MEDGDLNVKCMDCLEIDLGMTNTAVFMGFR